MPAANSSTTSRNRISRIRKSLVAMVLVLLMVGGYFLLFPPSPKTVQALPDNNICQQFHYLGLEERHEWLGPEVYLYDAEEEWSSRRGGLGMRVPREDEIDTQKCVMEFGSQEDEEQVLVALEIELGHYDATCEGYSSGIPRPPWNKDDLGEAIAGFEVWDRDSVMVDEFIEDLNEYGSDYSDVESVSNQGCNGPLKVRSHVEIRNLAPEAGREEEQPDRQHERERLDQMITLLYELRTAAYHASMHEQSFWDRVF